MARPRASISGRRLPLFFLPPRASISGRREPHILGAADCRYFVPAECRYIFCRRLPPRRWPLKFFPLTAGNPWPPDGSPSSFPSARLIRPLSPLLPFRPPHPPLAPSAPFPSASSAPCPLCSPSVRLIRPLPSLLPFRPPLRSYPSPSGVSVFCSSLAQNGFPGLLFPNFGYGIMNCEFFFVTLHGYRHLFELW